MKATRFLWLVVLGGYLATNFSSAQTWIQTSAPTNSWRSVASSADGTRLVAVADSTAGIPAGPGAIYLSTNSGVTWNQSGAPGNYWGSVASSADGTKLVALAGGPYTSTNSGATWTSDGLTNGLVWWSAVSSADGTVLAALAAPFSVYPTSGAVFISTNSGMSWVSNSITEASLEAIACSADGTKMVVASSWGIYTSTNSGSDWSSWNVTNNVPAGWSAVASSADGTKLVAIKNSLIFISTDSGMTWTQTSAPATNWTAVASSADGSKLVAVAGGSNDDGPLVVYHDCPIYTSTDFGVTWISNSLPVGGWSPLGTSVASSADGGRLSAVVNPRPFGGGIWMLQTTPVPSISARPTNGSLALSWLVASTNFVLQQSTDLSSWSDLTNTPVLNLANLHDEVALPFVGTSSFYRLKTP